ncbi:hypothetical protein IFM89_001563 [Coptis chinensis]|uniref:Uncharacterized protein n=1 Tax=Coptis chinensis TaxID=261450 RepID=A0A835HC88_9MAGN|nr:hypothetical protein IFM89_001563 [Coptis chinensis]
MIQHPEGITEIEGDVEFRNVRSSPLHPSPLSSPPVPLPIWQFSAVLDSYVSADLICCNRLSLHNTAYDPFLPLTPHVINRSYTPDVSIFKDLESASVCR